MPRLCENLPFGEWLDEGVFSVQGGDGQWQKMPREIYRPSVLGLLWAEVQPLASIVTTNYNSPQPAGFHPSKRRRRR